MSIKSVGQMLFAGELNSLAILFAHLGTRIAVPIAQSNLLRSERHSRVVSYHQHLSAFLKKSIINGPKLTALANLQSHPVHNFHSHINDSISPQPLKGIHHDRRLETKFDTYPSS